MNSNDDKNLVISFASVSDKGILPQQDGFHAFEFEGLGGRGMPKLHSVDIYECRMCLVIFIRTILSI